MNKIKELRKENNITVAELAKELGISQSMLTNYENGNGTRDELLEAFDKGERMMTETTYED